MNPTHRRMLLLYNRTVKTSSFSLISRVNRIMSKVKVHYRRSSLGTRVNFQIIGFHLTNKIYDANGAGMDTVAQVAIALGKTFTKPDLYTFLTTGHKTGTIGIASRPAVCLEKYSNTDEGWKTSINEYPKGSHDDIFAAEVFCILNTQIL